MAGFILTGCGTETANSENSAKKTSSTGVGGTSFAFNVLVDSFHSFSHRSDRAKAFHYGDNEIWEFKTKEGMLRMQGRFSDEMVSMQSSIDLIYNNVFLQTKHPTEDKNISCKPADEPEGEIMRTVSSDGKTSSGNFKLVFVKCNYANSYPEVSVENMTLPITVKGDFKNIPAR